MSRYFFSAGWLGGGGRPRFLPNLIVPYRTYTCTCTCTCLRTQPTRPSLRPAVALMTRQAPSSACRESEMEEGQKRGRGAVQGSESTHLSRNFSALWHALERQQRAKYVQHCSWVGGEKDRHASFQHQNRNASLAFSFPLPPLRCVPQDKVEKRQVFRSSTYGLARCDPRVVSGDKRESGQMGRPS